MWIDAKQRPKSLGRDNRTDHVDVHLLAELLGRKFEHGARDGNAGIVDEAGQRLAAERGAHRGSRGLDRGFIGDVELQGREIGAELVRQTIGVGLLAHAAEHAEAAIEQQFGGGPADAGGRAGDDDRSHGSIPQMSRIIPRITLPGKS
jgi:hypothetical protein